MPLIPYSTSRAKSEEVVMYSVHRNLLLGSFDRYALDIQNHPELDSDTEISLKHLVENGWFHARVVREMYGLCFSGLSTDFLVFLIEVTERSSA